MPFDAQALTEAVTRCYAFARDNERFTPEQRQRFLFEGNRLRGQLIGLISKQFEETSPELQTANAALAEVTARLRREQEVLERYAETVGMIEKVVGALDDLLKLATSIVG